MSKRLSRVVFSFAAFVSLGLASSASAQYTVTILHPVANSTVHSGDTVTPSGVFSWFPSQENPPQGGLAQFQGVFLFTELTGPVTYDAGTGMYSVTWSAVQPGWTAPSVSVATQKTITCNAKRSYYGNTVPNTGSVTFTVVP